MLAAWGLWDGTDQRQPDDWAVGMGTRMKTVVVYIRWLITCYMLLEVWHHSHWSVALSLTLMYLGWEAEHHVRLSRR